MEASMRLCLVEDSVVAGLEPLTLTRPAFALLLGGTTLADKLARACARPDHPLDLGAVVRPFLAPLVRAAADRLAVNDRRWLARGPVLVANARWVPTADLETPAADEPWLGLCDGLPACAWVGPEQAAALEPNGVDAWFDALAARYPGRELGGEWIVRPWDLVARNADHLVRDFEHAQDDAGATQPPPHAAVVGPADRLRIHPTARIDPFTVFDTTGGPITVAAGVVVQPFTRVEGPSFIGPDTQLFRANLRGGVTLGPCCRIGGEVEQTIVHSYTNKYHEGFLGHAYIGSWVNLGAITSNSDLRNDYGEVHVPLGGDPVATGQAKVGCFVGDHTRTGMGSLLNTGTAIGVMCNVLPAGLLLPKHVPSFCAVLYGRVAPGFSLEQLFATARIVLGRRGQVFREVEEQLYLDLYEQTRLERERALFRAGDRRIDHWPVLAARAPDRIPWDAR
jgi:UDP-N-acetylglucosamine diphosphorylase/glucosamine-1-phosphate N-acetyltransferase